MQCYIYRSSIKDGLYVYLAEENGIEKLPLPVKKQLGNPEFAMTLELGSESKLGQEDVTTVLENLASQGFHIQMPRDVEQLLASLAHEASLKGPSKR